MLHTRNVRRFLALAALVAATTSCGDAVRNGSSAMYLTVTSFVAAPGVLTGTPSFSTNPGTYQSSVGNVSTTPPTVVDDLGEVVLALAQKNVLLTPTSNNQVTMSRYHVAYTRADRPNTNPPGGTPGVDVPYGFDGAMTGTIPPSGTLKFDFELVRQVAKEEAPLVQLEGSAVVINTITTVTFYGTDQVGNAINVTASMSIEFGSF
jgi:hypothetical protein